MKFYCQIQKETNFLLMHQQLIPKQPKNYQLWLKKKDSKFCDVPVSGGVGGAELGTLTFMVGGTNEEFEKSHKILINMGKNIFHCGSVGMGQVAKICNNLLLGISMTGVSEAMNLGDKLGIDPKILAKIINTSSGRCWSSDTYNPFPGVMENVPSSRNYNGGFQTSLMLKDIGLAIETAHICKVPLPLGNKTHEIYSEMNKTEFSTKDFSSVLQFLKLKKE